MDYKVREILNFLSENEYQTSGQLGKLVGASEKTIRTRLSDLNDEISRHGAEVTSKPRFGYQLVVKDREKWDDYLQQEQKTEELIPANSKERIDYLIAILLSRPDYVKIEELSEFLYVSQKTLSNELKKVEFLFEKFNIELERKPYYGVRAVGNEFQKRCCILQCFMISVSSFPSFRQERKEYADFVAEKLISIAKAHNIRFVETAFQNTVLYICLSINRMKKGIYIENVDINYQEEYENEIAAARELGLEIEKKYHIEIPETDIYYLSIYIAGKRLMNADSQKGPNYVISEEDDKLVMKILDEIYSTYNIELRDNLNFRIMLSQHLIPMRIRLKYGIPIEHIPLDEIKEKYFLALSMAQVAAAILADELRTKVSEDETACIAVYFALGMEEQKSKEKEKKKILLVCVSGRASSQMLVYRFRQEFKAYIESIDVCGMYDFEEYDLSSADLIFTTVPLYKKVDVPVMEIHDFLENKEIMQVKHFLQSGEKKFLYDFYHKKYFFNEIEGDTREEVLENLCKKIGEQTELPDGFLESVNKREEFGPTDFGNRIAIPHPCEIMTKETIVAVAVLKQEIVWSTHRVKLIVLTALSEENSKETQKFYEATTNFLMSREAVQEYIQNPGYEKFMELMEGRMKKNE